MKATTPDEPEDLAADQSEASQSTPQPDPALYKAYESHATALRAWLVAYGVGGPVLMLTNERLSAVIADAGHASLLAGLFLTGVSLQILLAALNKYVMWLNYYSDIDSNAKGRRSHQVAERLAPKVWIDLLVDLATLVVFGWATFRILVDVAAAA